MDPEALESLARAGIRVTPHQKDLLCNLWLKICAHENEGKAWRPGLLELIPPDATALPGSGQDHFNRDSDSES